MRILIAIVVATVALGAAPATASQGRLAVVQFGGPIEGAWYDALEATGAEVVWYQPRFSYLVRGTEAQLARAARGPGVRAVTPYTTDDKLVGDPSGHVAVSVVTTDGVATRDAELGEREIDAIAEDPGVVAIAPAPEPRPLDERAGQILLGRLDGAFQPVLGTGYLDALSRLGVGESDPSFVVDVADTGLDVGVMPITHNDFRENGHPQGALRIAYLQDETGGGDARDCYEHGTHVASTIAGYNSGTGSSPPETAVEDAQGFHYGLGVAPRARIGVTRLFGCDGVMQDSRSFTEIASDRYARGARITNNSWGTGSSGFASFYDEHAREYDAIVRDAQPSVPGNQQMVEVFSTGNGGRAFPPFFDGYYTVGSPSLAKNVIAVGASESVRPTGLPAPCGNDASADSARDIAQFSSRGPTVDERIKPDVVAPGTQIVSAASHADDAPPLRCPRFPVGSQFYRLASGTSMAAPQVTGAAALLREWYRRTRGNGTLVPSPAMTKALLVNTATDLVGGDEGREGPDNPAIPARSQGWGRVNLTQLFENDRRVLRDQSDVIPESGFVENRTFTVADPTQPIKVTLAWTDAPGPLTGDAAVNDLDLTVVKGGVSYRGNAFEAGVSAAGGLPDRRNNLENVFLPAGSGRFAVLVDGFNIAGDGVPGNGDPTDQDYALVVSNALPAPEPAVMPAEDDGITVADGGDGDGTPEPGERVTLRVRAVNTGDGPAPGAAATLSGGDLAPLRPSADYPPLDVGAAAEQELVGRIPSGTACGTSVAAVVEIRQPNRRPYARTVAVPVGGDPSEVTDSQTHTPRLMIPDNTPAGVSSTIVVPPGARSVGGLKVRIDDLAHHYVGDLKLTLTGPNGRTVVLADEPGLGAGGSPGNDLSGVVFDDAAGQPIDAIPNVDATVPPGSYRPDEPLSAFIGTPTSGTWTLTAIDERAGVLGTLGGWSLLTRRFHCSNPAAAATGAATNVTARTATVAGTVDAGGVPTDYRIEYGTTTAYGRATPAASAGDGTGASVSATLTGLAPLTTYHYRVVALRNGAVVASGADATLTTPRLPVSPPGGGPAAPPAPRASVSFAATPTAIRVGPKRRFTLRFAGTRNATGTLRLTGPRIAIATAFRVASDGRAQVKARLSRRAFKRLVRRRKLPVRATATVAGATFSHAFTLKAPRRRR